MIVSIEEELKSLSRLACKDVNKKYSFIILKAFQDVFELKSIKWNPWGTNIELFLQGSNHYNHGKWSRPFSDDVFYKADHTRAVFSTKYNVRFLCNMPYAINNDEPVLVSGNSVSIWYLPNFCSWHCPNHTTLEIAGLKNVVETEEFRKDILLFVNKCKDIFKGE